MRQRPFSQLKREKLREKNTQQIDSDERAIFFSFKREEEEKKVN